MIVKKTKISNLFLINNFEIKDYRGNFVKIFNNQDLLKKTKNNINIKESFISENKKNSLRGMHVQINKTKSFKLVTCLRGKILDVCIDLRVKSKSYLQVHNQLLDSKKYNTILIPPGVGHGFLSLVNNSLVLYELSKNYNKKEDLSIDYRSIDFNWPIKKPIQSFRDKNALKLDEFILKYNSI